PFLALVESYEALLGAPALPCAVVPATGGVVDDGGPCFSRFGPAATWRAVEGEGVGGALLWTNAFDNPSPSNWARWRLHLEAAGRYDVQVHVVEGYNGSRRTPYNVRYNGRDQRVELDQAAGDGWRHL